MANATLRKLVTEYGGPGLVSIMSHLEKDSGFLQTAQAIPANGNWYHKYKKVDALPTFSFVNVGGSQTDQTVDDNLYQVDIKGLGSLQSEPKGVCENWPTGVRGYFSENTAKFAAAFGQKLSTVAFYGLDSTFGDVSGFKGAHAYAKSYSKVIQRGGATGSRCSIIAIKFDTIGCGLLYNPKIVQAGDFLEIKVLNNGELVTEVTDTTTGAKKLVYQVSYDGQIALLSSGSYDIAAMTQIDSTHLPTAPLMDQLVDHVRGSTSNTILYLNREARRYVRTLKTTALQMGVMDKNYDIQVDFWNGIPLVLDENLLSTESTVLD